MKTFNEFYNSQEHILNESSLSRLYRKYKESDSGTISACRNENTKDKNNKRTLELKTTLIKLGYSVTTVNGTYTENYGTPNAVSVKEKSFIVFDKNNSGNLKNDLIKLGEKYNQDSITYSSVKDGVYYLIGTNHSDSPGYHVEIKLGKPMFGKSGEFYSTIKGRPFVFESYIDDKINFDCTTCSYTIATIRCLKCRDDFVLSN